MRRKKESGNPVRREKKRAAGQSHTKEREEKELNQEAVAAFALPIASRS